MVERVFVYIDETGDRGNSAKASPIFGMAAVIVAERDAPKLRSAVRALRNDFDVPPGNVMSWKQHIKTHDRRRRAAEVLGALNCIRVCYVYARKSELAGSYRDDPTRFYNYVAYRIFKSAMWAARERHRDARVHVRYGHVRRHDHTSTERYIRTQASRDPKVPLDMLESLSWVSADRFLESQAADTFGGFLAAATWPQGRFGYSESAYLRTVWSRLRKSEQCAIPLGIMAMPRHDVLTSESWFPCGNCERAAT